MNVAWGAVELLYCATPALWFEMAERHIPTLLIDQANCEKKAAGTAVSLIYRYVDKHELLPRMSRLAREELRHFELVLKMLETLEIPYRYLSPSRYAGSMRALVRTSEPGRLIDTLVVGAIVEARSCERFAGMAQRSDGALREFYRRLFDDEARHFSSYLELARRYAADGGEPALDARIADFLQRDRELVLGSDSQFRFHSGVPE
jgi:tRNA-(ms[2]io[6]A)-hydroxylase